MKWSYRILSVRGIPIRVHLTLVILPILLSRDLDLLRGTILAIGMLTAITLHELGHSLVAVSKGCRVREILLVPYGGMAIMENIPKKPGDEVLMAIAGPLVSAFLAAVLIGLGPLCPLPPIAPETGTSMNALELIGWANLMFFLFNMLPAFPMDGGRILRAILTPYLTLLGATVVASLLGRSLAVLMVATGVFLETRELGGWTLVVVGVFVFITAGREYHAVEMTERSRILGSPFKRRDKRHSDWPDDDGEVIVEPPPYENGKGKAIDILPDK